MFLINISNKKDLKRLVFHNIVKLNGYSWLELFLKFAHFMMICNDEHQSMLPNEGEAILILFSQFFIALCHTCDFDD